MCFVLDRSFMGNTCSYPFGAVLYIDFEYYALTKRCNIVLNFQETPRQQTLVREMFRSVILLRYITRHKLTQAFFVCVFAKRTRIYWILNYF